MKSLTHRISIPSILKIEKKALLTIGKTIYNKNIKEIVVLIDPYMKDFLSEILEEGLSYKELKYEYIVIEDLSVTEMIHLAYQISGDTQAIVGIGGGKVLDIAKYISFLRRKPFISVPTSASNDGFASPVASIYIDNKRTTVNAKVPYGVIVDIDIIKNAPDSLLYSGIGDSISNYTAVYDMEYEKQFRDIEIDTFSKLTSIQSIEVLVKNQTSDIRDEKFLTSLLETLTMSGISMEIAGSSSPASGSEHLISHAMDQILKENNYPHGVQVGISTYLISILQGNRTDEIYSFLQNVGFIEHVKNLQIPRKYFIEAIRKAHTIKPYRKTIIHDKKMIEKAIEVVSTNHVFKELLH